MKVDSSLSRKLTVMSIAAMIAVVFIHSTAFFTLANPAKWNVLGEILITRSFSRWAVPFFFALSGFWLGRSGYMRGEIDYVSLLRKKTDTLMVPYLCWCVLGMLIALPLVAGNNLLTHKGLWERTVWEIPGLWNKIDAFFGLRSVGPKTNMPLWFVRSLIVLFLFAPVWRLIMRLHHGKILLLGIAITEIFFINILPEWMHLPDFACGWFLIGLCASFHHVESWHIGNGIHFIAAIAYTTSSIVLALISSKYMADNWNLMTKLEIGIIPFFGIAFYWGLYDRINWLHSFTISWCVKQTFFIYCIQEIICGYYISTARYVFGKTDVVTFCLTLVIPGLVCTTCMGLAIVIHRHFPRFYGIITGGRG